VAERVGDRDHPATVVRSECRGTEDGVIGSESPIAQFVMSRMPTYPKRTIAIVIPKVPYARG
jgi:hypothetical protein